MIAFLVTREHKMRPFISHLNMLELENSKLRKIVQVLQEQELQVHSPPTPVRTISLATRDERITQATPGVIKLRANSPTRCPPPQLGANVGRRASSLASCHLTSPASSSTNISNNARPCTLPPSELTSVRRFNPSEPMLKLPSAEDVKTAYEAQLSIRSPGYNCTCRPSGSLSTGGTDTRMPTTGKMTPTSRPHRTVTVKPSPRILGEIAFQLENRILDYIFYPGSVADVDLRERRSVYGYTVKNIPMMIQQEYINLDGSIDEHIRFQLKNQLKNILVSLAEFGYSLDEHSSFADQIINEYGLLEKAPDSTTLEIFGLGDADTLRDFVAHLAREGEDRKRMLVLLECLLYLANDDCRPVFLY